MDVQTAAIEYLIEILESAQRRQAMYFRPIDAVAVRHWINGLHAAVGFLGVHWSPELRTEALKRRGLEHLATVGEEEELQRRRLTPEQIVHELLAIEIEMWQADLTARKADQDRGYSRS
jgi:hypothetical protein